jgi:hypothetical protein
VLWIAMCPVRGLTLVAASSGWGLTPLSVPRPGADPSCRFLRKGSDPALGSPSGG